MLFIQNVFFEFLWIPKARSSVGRQSSMGNFNSIDSRWVVETTFKIWEISVEEGLLGVWLKIADRDIQIFHPLGFL